MVEPVISASILVLHTACRFSRTLFPLRIFTRSGITFVRLLMEMEANLVLTAGDPGFCKYARLAGKMDKRNVKVPTGVTKPILKSMESTICAKGYPKSGDSPHNSMVLHILRYLPSNIMTSGIEVPMTEYFDIEPWNECIVHEHIVEILNDRWLSASSIPFYIRYLGEVYFTENAELAGKFSFVSPHITAMIGGSGTSSNHLADCLLKYTAKDHLLLVPHNVGQHWILIAINTKTEIIYFMDPTPNAKILQRHDLKNFIESALRGYRTRRGGSITKAAMNRFNWANIQCPKQIEMDGIHCGHYICCYIEDIINLAIQVFLFILFISSPSNFILRQKWRIL